MRKALLTTAILGVVLSVLYLAEALRYSRGTAAQPGPGLYPLMVGGLLLVGAVGTGLEAVLRPSAGDVIWPTGLARQRVLAIVVAALGYVALLPYVGHPLAGTLLSLVVLHVMNLPGWPLRIAFALALALGSHYLFAVLLGVPLPAGIWFG